VKLCFTCLWNGIPKEIADFCEEWMGLGLKGGGGGEFIDLRCFGGI